MRPSIGRIVHYMLTAQDAAQINRRRTSKASIANRIEMGTWPEGAQAHVGHQVEVGDVLPMIVTRIEDSRNLNGQVFLDGNDTLFVTMVSEGEGLEGFWSWPKRED